MSKAKQSKKKTNKQTNKQTKKPVALGKAVLTKLKNNCLGREKASCHIDLIYHVIFSATS